MQFQDPDFKVVQKGVIDKLEKEGNVHYDPDWYNDFNKYMINTLGSEVEASYKYYIEEAETEDANFKEDDLQDIYKKPTNKDIIKGIRRKKIERIIYYKGSEGSSEKTKKQNR